MTPSTAIQYTESKSMNMYCFLEEEPAYTFIVTRESLQQDDFIQKIFDLITRDVEESEFEPFNVEEFLKTQRIQISSNYWVFYDFTKKLREKVKLFLSKKFLKK